MGVLGVACLVALTFVERRAAEPILPPALFRNRVFVVTSAVGFVVGFALFGALTFLPLFQQTVRGLSPTASGLQLLPVMGGLLITSIVSRPDHRAHRAATRSSRSSAPPSPALGMYLLSSLDETTSTGVAALHMLILGLGPRDGHAGARARGPELGALRHARRRHVGLDAVPLDRRLAGHGDPGRDLLGPAGGGGRERRRPGARVHRLAARRLPRRRRRRRDRVPAVLADPRGAAAQDGRCHRRRRHDRRPGRHRLAARADPRPEPRRRPRPDAGLHGRRRRARRRRPLPRRLVGAAAPRRARGAVGRRPRGAAARARRPAGGGDGRVARRGSRRGRPCHRRRAWRCAPGSSRPAPTACAS